MNDQMASIAVGTPYPKIGVGFVVDFNHAEIISIMKSLIHRVFVWLLFWSGGTLLAFQVDFDKVEATYFWGDSEDLAKTIDGIDASGRGWSVARQTDQPQAAIFKTAAPFTADLVLLTLCFQSGRPYGSMAEFSLSFTSDDQPSLKGNWRPLTIINQSATIGSLTVTPDGRIHAEEVVAVTTGSIPDNNYQVTARITGQVVTGFRIDVYPVRRTLRQLLPEMKEVADAPVMAWAMYGDFVLTEFRATVITHSTNVALGAPVKASHPLYQATTPVKEMTAAALTDGLPSTFAHPRQPDLGESCYFEIDLGRVHALDHLSLWGRNDGLQKEDRLSRVMVRLYEEDPAEGGRPLWQGMDRADGSHPLRGEVDILRAENGSGIFRGRYIRLSSDSPVPLSPQLAEVEAYPARQLTPVSLRADGREIRISNDVSIPPKTFRLALEMKVANEEVPREAPFRWRFKNKDGGWLISRGRTLEISCPAAGEYTIEAQASHSDGTWDASLMSLPILVRAPFTQSWSFILLVALCTLSVGGLVTWFVSRRRIAVLEAQSALAVERTRIARDIHDDVGARLSQLSFLLKSLERNPTLPESAKDDVLELSETASQALGSLDEVVWTVNPKNDSLESLARFLGQHAARYLAPVGITFRLVAPPAWPALVVSAQTRHNLVMAVKEALQNVVKHSAAHEVVMTLALKDGNLTVGLTDDGCGLPGDLTASGRSGLANMKARLESLGGACGIHRRPEGGTEVTLLLPLDPS
jgi:signal transduction histidine kinase